MTSLIGCHLCVALQIDKYKSFLKKLFKLKYVLASPALMRFLIAPLKVFTPPGGSQDNIMVAVSLLAGCLSYSNSAMNPVLYAFLSENFKKSFMKACTCATGRDANAALNAENSMMPRRRTLLGGGDKVREREREKE